MRNNVYGGISETVQLNDMYEQVYTILLTPRGVKNQLKLVHTWLLSKRFC
jgi:hypothetical protein